MKNGEAIFVSDNRKVSLCRVTKVSARVYAVHRQWLSPNKVNDWFYEGENQNINAAVARCLTVLARTAVTS